MSIAKGIVSPIFKQNLVSSIVRSILNIDETLFTPLDLFRNNEQGVWYDPSDLTTLFQDAAGTIPVTADGDPVGRVEDKSGNGNHATQSVAASRPVYQRGDSRGVVNLLKWSEDFDISYWVKLNSTVSSGVVGDPFGIGFADKLVESPATEIHRIRTPFMERTSGTAYTVSVYAKASERDLLYINADAFCNARATFNLATGLVESIGQGSAQSTSVGGGWYRCSVSGTASVTGSTVINFQINATQTLSADENYAGDGTSGIYIWGAQLEEGSTPTPYQRNDSHLGGVATGSADDLHWLAFDGVDDYLKVGSFTLSTQSVISLGLTPKSGRKFFIEHSNDANTNDGFFVLGTITNTQNFRRAGVSHVRNAQDSAWLGLSSAVVTNVYDTEPRLYKDGQPVALNAGGSALPNTNVTDTLYINSRAGASLFQNPDIYGIVIFGGVLDDGVRSNLEAYLSNKSGVEGLG